MKKSLLSVGLATSLAVAACSQESKPARPDYGVVTDIKKATFQQYKSVFSCEYEYDFGSGEFETKCKDRDKKAKKLKTFIITRSVCEKDGDKVVLASREYLGQHAIYPSDYPIIAEGTTAENIRCSDRVEVVAKDMGEVSIGMVLDTEKLDRIVPEYYE